MYTRLDDPTGGQLKAVDDGDTPADKSEHNIALADGVRGNPLCPRFESGHVGLSDGQSNLRKINKIATVDGGGGDGCADIHRHWRQSVDVPCGLRQLPVEISICDDVGAILQWATDNEDHRHEQKSKQHRSEKPLPFAATPATVRQGDDPLFRAHRSYDWIVIISGDVMKARLMRQWRASLTEGGATSRSPMSARIFSQRAPENI